MALLVPDASEVKFLELVLGVDTPEDCELHLYVNDVTPAASHIASTYTEMTQHAYSPTYPSTLTMASWVIATVSNVAQASYAQQTFTFTDDTVSGTVLVYGYYVTMKTSGVLLWAERFPVTASVAATGDTISVTPIVTLSTV